MTKFINLLFLAGTLFAFWMSLSLTFDSYLITCSIVATVASCLILKTLGIEPNFRIRLYFFEYIAILLTEIVKSSIATIKYIFKPTYNSAIKEIKYSTLTPTQTVLYGELITMTPGTVVINVTSKSILVHGLDSHFEAIPSPLLSSLIHKAQ